MRLTINDTCMVHVTVVCIFVQLSYFQIMTQTDLKKDIEPIAIQRGVRFHVTKRKVLRELKKLLQEIRA